MNSFTPEDFDFTVLEEGFCACDVVEQRINESSPSDDKDTFCEVDLGDILKKHLRWVRALPRVTPFYAVKCNDSHAVVMMLAALGTGFDCASKNEIQLVQSLGVDTSRIIYANPCKQVSHIKYTSAHGVQMMTFDSEVELTKIARYHENANDNEVAILTTPTAILTTPTAQVRRLVYLYDPVSYASGRKLLSGFYHTGQV